MPWKKLSCKITQVGLVSLSSLLWFSFVWASLALEFRPPDESSFEHLGMESDEIESFIPSRIEHYRRQTAGTKRCPVDANLIILVPSTLAGLTTQSHPSFFFYLIKYNQRVSNNIWIRFSLQDNIEQQEIYHTVIQPKLNQQGISSVSIPAGNHLFALEINHTYTWKFQIFSEDDLVGSYVQGLITRVAIPVDLATEIEQTSQLKKASIYAHLGIWYDALATLVELRYQDPQNLTLMTEWNELLASVGLENTIYSAPLIPEANSNTFLPSKCL